MKIGFGNYTYFDSNADDKNTYKSPTDAQKEQYAFNQEKFNQLIANRQYNDAADYAAKYHFKDPKTQREHENDIINLRRNGRILGAIYSRIYDKDALDQIEFYDKVFVDGGLEQLTENEYANKFKEYKRRLGSSTKHTWSENLKISKEATKLGITFQPKKRTLLGIDWLAKDNENNIDNFYEQSGLNEQQLKTAGVEVINRDGKTTLKFDKTNKLANQIIFNLPNDQHRLGDTPLVSDGSSVGIVGYDSDGQAIGYTRGHEQINDLINYAKSTKESYFQKTNLAEKDYSSTIGPAIDDNLEELKAAYAAGEINETTFNRQYNILGNNVINAIKSLGSGNHEMYTNAYNEKDTDETLISADDEQRAHLANLISATNPKNLQLLSMCSNGKIGTLVVINAGELSDKQQEKLDRTAKPEERYGTRRIEIFIPGFMKKQAQAKINTNTSTRSIQEANSMLDWNYTYKCYNGVEIIPDGKGGFVKNNKPIDKNEAIKEINKDMIIQDTVSNLKYNYLSWNGNLISDKDNSLRSAEEYEKMARLIAVNAANELNPEVPLTKTNGSNYTVDELFNMKGLSTSEYWYNESKEYGEISQSLPYQLNLKIHDIYSIYDDIMKELQYYNIDPDFKIKK
uniref:Uncharacterized protein n=1 Tax=Geladintestivirus 6 TaxID=3233138 RepID=A0AAU8MJ59_9CAUD